jgi:hypothetical protein
MAVLALQSITPLGGTQVTYTAAAAGGDKVPSPGPNTLLHVKNGGASPITVTVAVPNVAFNGATVPGTAVTVANATEKFIPITAQYTDVNGQANISYSAVTSVTVAALVDA